MTDRAWGVDGECSTLEQLDKGDPRLCTREPVTFFSATERSWHDWTVASDDLWVLIFILWRFPCNLSSADCFLHDADATSQSFLDRSAIERQLAYTYMPTFVHH